jgi:hypothetical protein
MWRRCMLVTCRCSDNLDELAAVLDAVVERTRDAG